MLGGGGGGVDHRDDVAAVHGLSALMQMAGISFDPSTYTEVPLDEAVHSDGGGAGSESKSEEISTESGNASAGVETKSNRIHINIYGTSDDDDSSSELESDDEFGLLSRP